MAIDEELLRPSREHLACLQSKIAAMEADAMERASRYPDDEEYVRDVWHRFNMTVFPMRREIEAVGKVIADYYALQADPPPIVVPAVV